MNIAKLVKSLDTVNDLFKDSMELLWIPVLIQIVSEIEVILRKRKGNMYDPDKYTKQMSNIRQFLDPWLLQNWMLCDGLDLDIAISKHVIDVKDFVSCAFLPDTIDSIMRVDFKGTLSCSFYSKQFDEREIKLIFQHNFYSFLMK